MRPLVTTTRPKPPQPLTPLRRLILIPAQDLPSQNVYGRDLPIHHYRHHLGLTQQHLYWDATAGLHPTAFSAIAGSIQHPYHLHLHLPSHYPNGDPDHQRMLDYGRPIHLAQPNFNQRLRRLITQHPQHPHPHTPQTQTIDLTPKKQILLGKRGRGR